MYYRYDSFPGEMFVLTLKPFIMDNYIISSRSQSVILDEVDVQIANRQLLEHRRQSFHNEDNAKAYLSRLQFPEQSLKNLREEGSLSSLGHTSEAVRSRSSSVMSLVDNYDSQICDQHFPSQEPLEAEEVTGH